MKECSNTKCKGIKQENEFYKKKSSFDGLSSACKKCESERRRLAYASRSECKVDDDKKKKKLYSQNLEVKEKRRVKDRQRNVIETRRRRSDIVYLEECRNKRKNYNINIEGRKITKRKWRRNNKHLCAWRQILADTHRRMGTTKENHTIDELGYSAIDLKNHLQSLFTEGMSWDNHGEWHIDHKKPVSKFSKETKPSVVNSLSNLQPLWAFDNLSKGDR